MPLKINGLTTGSATLQAQNTGSDITLTLPGSTATLATTANVTAQSGLVPITPSSVVNGSLSGYTTTFSSVSSVSLNGVFSSTYDNYRVIINNFTHNSAGQVQVWMRLRLSGTDASGATDYKTQWWRLYGGVTAANGGSTGQNLMSLGYASTGGKASYSMDIMDPGRAATTTQVFQGHAYQSDIATYIAINGSNSHTVSTAYDGFTISSDSSTFSGTVRVYAYAQ